MEAVAELGRETIDLPANPGRPARQLVLALRARKITLVRPKRNHPAEAAKLPQNVTLTLVEAREVDPPDAVTPVHWRLLTTHTVVTLAHARRITGFYRQRWTIEQVFRVMKTKGFDIEAVRVAEDGPFENLTIATLIAAVQVLQMVRERDGVVRPVVHRVLPNAAAGREVPLQERPIVAAGFRGEQIPAVGRELESGIGLGPAPKRE